MTEESKKVKYPENLPLKEEVKKSGLSVSFLAGKIGCSRETLSNTLNGNYKGVNIVTKVREYLATLPDSKETVSE